MDATFGQFATNALLTMVSVATPIVATYAVQAFAAFAKKKGIEVQKEQLDELDKKLVNGMNAGAAEVVKISRLPPGTDVRKYVMDSAISYVQRQAPALLNDLKAKVEDPKTMEALKARMETLIAKDDVPTPKMLAPIPANPAVTVTPSVDPASLRSDGFGNRV